MIRTTLIATVCALSTLAATAATAESDLVLSVKTLSDETGALYVALYASEAAWLTDETFRVDALPMTGAATTVTFKDVPAGDYAVAVFVDQNGNERLDAAFNFVPQEPYGFSNDSARRFGAAEWDDAVFQHDGAVQTLHVGGWPAVVLN